MKFFIGVPRGSFHFNPWNILVFCKASNHKPPASYSLFFSFFFFCLFALPEGPILGMYFFFLEFLLGLFSSKH